MPRLWDALGASTIAVFVASLFALSARRGDQPRETPDLASPGQAGALTEGQEWLGLYLRDEKLGFAHIERVARPDGAGLTLRQETHLRLDVLGASQRLDLTLSADLSPDLTLERFAFEMGAGPQALSGHGRVDGATLQVTLNTGGQSVERTLPLTSQPVLREALGPLLAARALEPGQRFTLPSFDPWSTATVPVEVEVIGHETTLALGQVVPVTRVRQTVHGMTFDALISPRGEVLEQALPLGLVARRESEEEARWGLAGDKAGRSSLLDSIEIVVPGLPETLDAEPELRLRVGGPADARAGLHQPPRQTLEGDLLRVVRGPTGEGAPRPVDARTAAPEVVEALRAEPLVQSSHPKLRAAAREIVGDAADTLTAARRIVAWMRTEMTVERAAGAPSALETLASKRGDCNEWASLFAALARAEGVPTRLAFGLVWQRGRFRYHAWNEVLASRGWVPIDALWDQVPAGVGHIALASGSTDRQTVLLNSMGRLTLDRAP